MNPEYSSAPYPDETVALQDRGHGASPGQPGGPTGVQHTVVNVPTEPTKDYLVWSLWNFVYGNIFCLGLAALIYSVKARDRKMVGDQNGAIGHASTAQVLNIVATVLTSLIVFLVIVVPIAVVASAARPYSYYQHRI
ncbi:interferon-induced transmembrane protein 1-like [Poecilia reticulata]|uniref:Interferon-induced transmembrane protein 1-like n=1 Tax=Poecilia reticulata TaxID=8081 RepID=A0A3P9P930_POERE|nr:PREDICTED: interferon-induced transmembrane protein 1-like [Poecilia reticulata]